jgi:hypothetical protein
VLLSPARCWATIGQQLSWFRMESLVIAARKAHGKSRVTNRSNELFVEPVDKRSAAARRFKDVLTAIVSDLGGPDRLSEGQKQLCRRCALLAVEAEKLEARSISGEDIDVDRFGMMTDRLGRALGTGSGYQRRSKFGFFVLSHARVRPLTYREPTRFETMPSKPMCAT